MAEKTGVGLIKQSLPDWMEWKQKCAISKCSVDVQSKLRAFLWNVAEKQTASLPFALSAFFAPPAGPIRPPASSGDDALAYQHAVAANTLWAYFEQRASAGHHASGKRYKEWIFDYAAGIEKESQQLAAILQGAKLQLIMVLRDVLASEISLQKERRTRRVDDFSTGDQPDHDHWLEQIAEKAADLLNTSEMVAVSPEQRNDYEEIADDLAKPFWTALTHRDRVVLWAKFHNIPLNDKRVVDAAGAEKSQLYACCKQIDLWLEEKIHQLYAGEDEIGIRFLRATVLCNLLSRLENWIKSENLQHPLFKLSEDRLYSLN